MKKDELMLSLLESIRELDSEIVDSLMEAVVELSEDDVDDDIESEEVVLMGAQAVV